MVVPAALPHQLPIHPTRSAMPASPTTVTNGAATRPAYFDAFPNLAFERDDRGVLTVRWHTEGGPLVFDARAHSDFPEAFHQVARDRANKLVVLTGTGDEWIAQIDFASFGDVTDPLAWDRVVWEGREVLRELLSIEVPVVCLVNGDARVHTEYALTCDLVLAAEGAVFQDAPHLGGGIVPGDGLHVLWPLVLGPIRGKRFLWLQEEIPAEEALRLGAVSEVLPRDELVPRAMEIADGLLALPELTRRYTRELLNQRPRRLLEEGLGYGLALEGLSATQLG